MCISPVHPGEKREGPGPAESSHCLLLPWVHTTWPLNNSKEAGLSQASWPGLAACKHSYTI